MQSCGVFLRHFPEPSRLIWNGFVEGQLMFTGQTKPWPQRRHSPAGRSFDLINPRFIFPFFKMSLKQNSHFYRMETSRPTTTSTHPAALVFEKMSSIFLLADRWKRTKIWITWLIIDSSRAFLFTIMTENRTLSWGKTWDWKVHMRIFRINSFRSDFVRLTCMYLFSSWYGFTPIIRHR